MPILHSTVDLGKWTAPTVHKYQNNFGPFSLCCRPEEEEEEEGNWHKSTLFRAIQTMHQDMDNCTLYCREHARNMQRKSSEREIRQQQMKGKMIVQNFLYQTVFCDFLICTLVKQHFIKKIWFIKNYIALVL